MDSETDLDDIYIAHFKNPEALKKASGVIGGGVKGKFKVKYSEIMAKSSRRGAATDTFWRRRQQRAKTKAALRMPPVSHAPPPKIFELRRKKKP